jgi:beta propeller repeat protein
MTEATTRTHTGTRWAVLALAVFAVLAVLPAAAVAAPVPFIVCNQFGGQAGPDIAGAMAVWTDNRNGNLDVYGKDLGTGKDYAVCTNQAQQDNPSVTRRVLTSGKVHYVAVWVDKRNHPSGDAADIYGRDITARDNFLVARNARIKWYPDIAGNWVVWLEADDAAGPYDVKARDLAARKTYLIASSKVLSPVSVDSRTLASGKVVTTAVYTTGAGNISARNLPDGDPFIIAQKDVFEWMPDISHNRVVWWESGNRVMYRDLKTKRHGFVHAGARPRINGELITWDGGGHGGEFVIDYVAGAKIFVRNIVRSTSVTSFGVSKQTNLFPAISGHRVVWEAGPARRVLTHIHIYGARVR